MWFSGNHKMRKPDKYSVFSKLHYCSTLIRKGQETIFPPCLSCLVFEGYWEGKTETVKQIRANVCRRHEDIQTQPGFLSLDPWKLSPTVLFLFVFFFLPFCSLASSERQQTAGLPSALSQEPPRCGQHGVASQVPSEEHENQSHLWLSQLQGLCQRKCLLGRDDKDMSFGLLA